MKTLCRIFVEAGECYMLLALSPDDDGRHVREAQSIHVFACCICGYGSSPLESCHRIACCMYGNSCVVWQMQVINAIANCTMHPDTDIVGLTFKFWSDLGESVGYVHACKWAPAFMPSGVLSFSFHSLGFTGAQGIHK